MRWGIRSTSRQKADMGQPSLRASSHIARLPGALLIACITLGCSEPTEPTESFQPTVSPQRFVDHTTASGFGGPRFGPLLPNSQFGAVIGGVAAGDVDNDGDIDLFVVSEGTGENTLYVNQGDGTFSATLLAALSDTPLFESGPLFVDYDGDGLLDIIMGGVRKLSDRDQLNSVRVYRNLGGLNFVDASATAGVTPPLELETYSITAADINGDQLDRKSVV